MILKALIYLQDHTDNDHALQVIDGSHRIPRPKGKSSRQLRPRKGSVVFFEQRMTHRGQTESSLLPEPLPVAGRSEPRVVITIGYGANNVYTDEFETGTRVRQARMVEGCPSSGLAASVPTERWARWVGRKNGTLDRLLAQRIRDAATERESLRRRVSREWLRSQACPPGSDLRASNRNLTKGRDRALVCRLSTKKSRPAPCVCPGRAGVRPWLAYEPSWCDSVL